MKEDQRPPQRFFARFHTLDGLQSKLYDIDAGSVVMYIHRLCINNPQVGRYDNINLPESINLDSRRYYLKERKQVGNRAICEYYEDTKI